MPPDGYRANQQPSTATCLLNFSNPTIRLLILSGMFRRSLDMRAMSVRTRADSASSRNRLPDGSAEPHVMISQLNMDYSTPLAAARPTRPRRRAEPLLQEAAFTLAIVIHSFR